MALRGCNRRFRQRFHEMELASDRPLEEVSAPELEELWAQAKRKLAAEAEVEASQAEAQP
jgi:XTP/dITP diphosphohydrolase/ATP diphosphatase